MKRIIKDPTYNIYSKGGSVETRKNRLTKEDLKLLASESPREEFELDLGSILPKQMVVTIQVQVLIQHWDNLLQSIVMVN